MPEATAKCPKPLRYEKKVKHVQLQFWMLSQLRYVNWWLNAPHNAYITLNVNDALLVQFFSLLHYINRVDRNTTMEKFTKIYPICFLQFILWYFLEFLKSSLSIFTKFTSDFHLNILIQKRPQNYSYFL